MKKINLLMGLILISTAAFSQIGVGTLTPNTKSLLDLTTSAPTFKGLMLPRMTAAERTGMNLSTLDAGMMVYQTTAPKGLFTFDGSAWINSSIVDAGSGNNTTLYWNSTQAKWIPTSNIFNGGGSVGIGSFSSISPNYQLHLHSTSAFHTRLQLTSGSSLTAATDGLIIGIGNTQLPSMAYLLQQENKPLWFGTNSIERMRIDSAGRVGINEANPTSTLDVNGTMDVSGSLNVGGMLEASGTFKLGAGSPALHNIFRTEVIIDPPAMGNFTEWTAEIAVANLNVDAVVYTSPAVDLEGYSICYSRVSATGMLRIKIMRTFSGETDLGPITLRVAVIQ